MKTMRSRCGARRVRRVRRVIGVCAVLTGTLALASAARAEEIIAVTANGRVITFDSATPGTIASSRTLSGINGIVGIDVRPADGVLYAVTGAGTLFRIDRNTGNAYPVGSASFAAGLGPNTEMDFNPVADRVRVVNDLDRNMRVNPSDASLVDGNAVVPGVQEDGQLNFSVGDLNFAVNPNVVAAAYTNNTAGAAATTLYGIDSALDVLVTINPPNAGMLQTVGSLGLNAGTVSGFDVSGSTTTAYTVLSPFGQITSQFYTVNLATGALTLVAAVGDPSPIIAMTVGPATAVAAPPSVALVGLTPGGELIRFQSDTPGTIASRVLVNGLVANETLVGIDTRPSNGRLYGISSGDRIYVVNEQTGLATQIRSVPFEVLLTGSAYGFEFDPATNRARIVSDLGQNFRVHPDTGAVIDGDAAAPGVQADASLAYAAGDANQGVNPRIVGAANDRNATPGATTLWALDGNLGTLVRLGSVDGTTESSNAGILHTIGGLGVTATAVSGFEIALDSTALASLVTGGTTRLFTIDLTTGAAALIGDVGVGETLLDLAVAPTSNPAVPGADLVVRTLTIGFDYARADRDTVTLSGSVPYVAAPFDGQVVTIDIGGFAESFVLNAKGKGKNDESTRSGSDDDTFAFTGKPKDGRIKFTAKLRREDLSDELTDEGMDGSQTLRKQGRTVVLTISVNGTTNAVTVPLTYTSKAAKNGKATKAKS